MYNSKDGYRDRFPTLEGITPLNAHDAIVVADELRRQQERDRDRRLEEWQPTMQTSDDQARKWIKRDTHTAADPPENAPIHPEDCLAQQTTQWMSLWSRDHPIEDDDGGERATTNDGTALTRTMSTRATPPRDPGAVDHDAG